MHELEKKESDRSATVSPVPITLIATSGTDEIARCEAKVDCEFLGVCSVSDQWFLDVKEDSPNSFVVEIEDEHYPVEVKYMAEGNKFVLTDPRGISAVRGVALGIHKVTLQ